MKPSGIGGMAVIEGVMMKNKDEYAVAVRKPNNEIAVEKKTHKDFSDKVKLFKLPIFRGMLAFVDSMVIGVKVLNFSASFFDEEEEQEESQTKNKKTSKNKKKSKDQKPEEDFVIEELSIADEVDSRDDVTTKEKDDKTNALLMAAAVLVSILISVSFFMVLPVLISNLFAKIITNPFALSLLEGVLRVLIFIGYVILASRMQEIKRVFMYHGAEHKTINCLENGMELTVENVKWQSKQHKRCGTSFMLLVMLISLVFFMILQPGTLLLKVLSRVLLIPIIAGVSYEFIRLAGKKDNKVINILSKPGLWMQALTTKEPDDAMIEVAIQSVETVFDWRSFLDTSSEKEKTVKKAHNNKEKNKTQSRKVSYDKVPEKSTTTGEMKAKNDHHRKEHAVKAEEIKMTVPKRVEEEDDEILKALDKYLDFDEKNAAN